MVSSKSNMPVPKDAAQAARTSQIIIFALVQGVFAFGLVAVLSGEPAQPDAGQPMLSYIAASVAVLMILARFTVPQIIVGSQRGKIAQQISTGTLEPENVEQQKADGEAFGRLYALFQTKTIIAGALLEFASFFNLVGYMIERQSFSLVITVVLLALLLSLFPTRTGIENWTEGEIATIEQMRQI